MLEVEIKVPEARKRLELSQRDMDHSELDKRDGQIDLLRDSTAIHCSLWLNEIPHDAL